MTYWEERAIASVERMEGKVYDETLELIDSFNRAKHDLQKEINGFYGRYARENKISLSEAQKHLDFNELKEFKGDLKAFQDLTKKSIGTYDLTLNNLSTKVRITRLQALEFQCDTVLQRLYQRLQDNVERTVSDVYTDQFYHSQFEIEQYTGFAHAFSQATISNIAQVLKTPVQGADISTRLWRQDMDTGFKIRQTLNNMFVTGRPPQDFAKELQRIIGTRDSKGGLTGKQYEAYRLLYNESSYASGQASLAAYKSDGVEKYEIIATLDGKTSQICREQDGKHYPLDKAVVGVTFIPFHVNCRTAVAPYIQAEGYNSTRMARDPDTGKSIRVPQMDYHQWYETRVKEHGDPLTKGSGGGTMKVGRDDKMINNIEKPIEQRHTGKGEPNAILHFNVNLNNRQQKILDVLQKYDDNIIVKKKSVNMKDLSALTAQTGCEFAMFTKGNERLIIRGNEYLVNVNEKIANKLALQGYTWSGHTHPGVDFNCMQPSDGDYAILMCFKQKKAAIYNSKGRFSTFDNLGGD